MPRSRYRFLGDDAPYFMTMTVNHWLPLFTRPEAVAIVLDSWRYLQAHHGFRLHGSWICLSTGAGPVPGITPESRDRSRWIGSGDGPRITREAELSGPRAQAELGYENNQSPSGEAS